jgi:2-phosphoglycerate kinase
MVKAKQVVPQVAGKEIRLAFSAGILINSLQTIGISYGAAQAIARNIETRLAARNIKEIDRKELRQMVSRQIRERIGEQTAQKYMRFRKIMELKRPLILMLGGSTGSGKNAVSVLLAHQLDIMNVMTTDIIRESMRTLFSEDVFPLLHTSSYLAHTKLKAPLKEERSRRVTAFREQALRVNAGIRGIIKRAIQEKTSLIINGVHVLPDIITKGEFKQANIIKVFTYIKAEEKHKKRFHIRGMASEERSARKYLKNFKTIRIIQNYILNTARANGYPCINNRDIKKTAQKVIDHIIREADP